MAVGGGGFAANQAALFDAADDAREAAAWLQDRVGQVGHAQPVARHLGESHESVVVGLRQAVMLARLLPELAAQADADPQQAAPGGLAGADGPRELVELTFEARGASTSWTDEQWDASLQITLLSAVRAIRAVLPSLVECVATSSASAPSTPAFHGRRSSTRGRAPARGRAAEPASPAQV